MLAEVIGAPYDRLESIHGTRRKGANFFGVAALGVAKVSEHRDSGRALSCFSTLAYPVLARQFVATLASEHDSDQENDADSSTNIP